MAPPSDLLDQIVDDIDDRELTALDELAWIDDEEMTAVVEDESVYDEIPEDDQLSLDEFVDRCLAFTEVFCDMSFYKYQVPLARRIWETLVYGDGAELTVLCARQSGKSQTIANCIAAAMVLLPKMANLGLFPEYLEKFKRGLWVGVFGPIEDQGATIWGRVKSMLTSDRAVEMMLDPEIDERIDKDKKGEKAKLVTLKSSGSLCRLQTASPKANIESKTYHLVCIDEAQDADGTKLTKSIYPMTTMTNGSKIISGTANREKSYFYTQIRLNRRRWNNRRGKNARCNHIEWDWKQPARENRDYAKAVKARIREIGEDSDEFQMAYCNRFLLEQGMFITEEQLGELFDVSMELVPAWWRHPVVVGIDPARTSDSTVVTVVWVDWDRVDPYGFHEHRVLDWLEIHNKRWEDQYGEIWNFLQNYNVARIAVDANGQGSAVADRLEVLFGGRCEVHALGSSGKEQNDRWVYLDQVIQRKQLIIPGHSKARRVKRWRKFHEQMTSALKVFKGGNMLVEAPEERQAHDDYVDSLCLAVWMTKDHSLPEVEVSSTPFYGR